MNNITTTTKHGKHDKTITLLKLARVVCGVRCMCINIECERKTKFSQPIENRIFPSFFVWGMKK